MNTGPFGPAGVSGKAELVLSAPELGEGEDTFFGNLLLHFGCNESYSNEVAKG